MKRIAAGIASVVFLALSASAAAGLRNLRSNLPATAPRSTAAPDLSVFRFKPDAIPLADQCTGSALTGTRGEVLTVTRASTAACNKEDGTVVFLGNSTPRLQVSGVAAEPSVTNRVIRGTAFDNAAWTATDADAAAADSQVAPDGTTTAEALTSTGAGGYYESTAFTNGSGTTAATSIYIKSTSGTQDMHLELYDSTAGAQRCLKAATATTTWTRIECITSSGITALNNHVFRVYPGTTTGTGSIVAWGAQHEGNATRVTSIIVTAAVAASRSADAASFASFSFNPDPTFHIKLRMTGPPYASMPQVFFEIEGVGGTKSISMSGGATNKISCVINDGTHGNLTFSSANSTITPGVEAITTCAFDGTNVVVCVNASCTTTAKGTLDTTLLGDMSTLRLGSGTGTPTTYSATRDWCIARGASGVCF